MTTNFPKLPENERTIADAFVSELLEMGWGDDGQIPDKAYRAEIAGGARRFANAIGEHPKLLIETMRYMKEQGIFFSDPGSCIKLARKAKAWKEEEYVHPDWR